MNLGWLLPQPPELPPHPPPCPPPRPPEPPQLPRSLKTDESATGVANVRPLNRAAATMGNFMMEMYEEVVFWSNRSGDLLGESVEIGDDGEIPSRIR